MRHHRKHGVAPAPRGIYYPRLRTVRILLPLLLVMSACAPRAGAGSAAPGAVDSTLVDSARIATAPGRRLQVQFDWSMQDRDARFSGKGVVRIAPPYRARLDLFGPRGESYLAAVLEEEALRLAPPAAAVLLPPPAFLWASLGVFRRPADTLTAARRSAEGAIELAFEGAQERWRFALAGNILRSVEWFGPDGGRRTVELTGAAAHGLPARGTYRDWREFRELTLSVTSVEEVDAFPADIWMVGGQR